MALVIVTGTVLGFLRIMGENLQVSRETELRTIAMLLAEGEVERIKGAWYDGFTDVTASNQDLGDGYLANYYSPWPSVGTYLNSLYVQVGYDSDDDGILDSEEILVRLDTQYADG